MQTITMNKADHDHEAKLGQKHLPHLYDTMPAARPFRDDLEHLQALEQEAILMLAVFSRRKDGQTGKAGTNGKGIGKSYGRFGLPDNITPEELAQHCEEVRRTNRGREAATLQAGIALRFETFCREHQLDAFCRNAILILLVAQTSSRFIALLEKLSSEIEDAEDDMNIGTLLGIICKDYTEELSCRRYFSVASHLIRDELVTVQRYQRRGNILHAEIELIPRLVRHLIGDDNLYSDCFRFTCKEKSLIRLDQVILPSGMKEQAVLLIEDYYANEARRQELGVEEFFGYGIGLSLLFSGPSGTGKTMLAKAIANRFGRQIFELRLDEVRQMDSSIDEVLKSVFQEAALQGGIVFIDECDDLFRDDSSASRALLIELERSRCVTILATNKAIELDPALERRLSVRLKFSLPDAELRAEIWQALIPENVSLARDVDLKDLAATYAFSGGLIKNAVFMAINSAMGKAASQTPVHHRGDAEKRG